uniref:Vps16 C-terminal domain-containing protein n=1 Tax=Lactuca sativa TaxID=4236 RepID=A0A9R1VRS8_LACSA|nr:hypothetical protein LSAT_V11C400194640 [Lactuca sativa]
MDEELDEPSASVETIGYVGLTIHDELLSQEKVIEDLGSEMESTYNRLDFVLVLSLDSEVFDLLRRWRIARDLSVSISVFDESQAMDMDGERYRGIFCMKWLSGYIILDKLKLCISISYVAVAAHADQTSRRKLALFQVPLLLGIGEEDTALTKATESGDTDHVYLVLFHIWQKFSNYWLV